MMVETEPTSAMAKTEALSSAALTIISDEIERERQRQRSITEEGKVPFVYDKNRVSNTRSLLHKCIYKFYFYFLAIFNLSYQMYTNMNHEVHVTMSNLKTNDQDRKQNTWLLPVDHAPTLKKVKPL